MVFVGCCRHRGAVVVPVVVPVFVLIPQKFLRSKKSLVPVRLGFVFGAVDYGSGHLRLRLRLRSSSVFRLRLPSSVSVFGLRLQIGLEFRILILERGLVLR